MLKQSLQQKLLQKLSPQQIQFIKLLEVPTVQLNQRIKNEIEENPALEEGAFDEDFDHSSEEMDEPKEQEEFSIEDYLDDEDTPFYKLQARNYSKNDEHKEIPFSQGTTFHEALIDQLGLRIMGEEERKLAEYIIGNIDDDGYLRRELEAIVDDLAFSMNIETSEEQLRAVLEVIQDFDPPGVGAESLQECLLIQIRRKEKENSSSLQLADVILTDFFNEFTKKHYDKIIDKLNISEEELRDALNEILRLNPKPGGAYNNPQDKTNHSIVPDFVLENNDGRLELTLNGRNVPDLKVSRTYTQMLEDVSNKKTKKTKSDKETFVFVKQKLDAAKWFIDAIKQRQETLVLTMQAIIDYQKPFFLDGDDKSLKPMILKDIADITGLDISTVSRVANSKYIQTDFGTFSLKSFFSEAMQTTSGDEVSAREVKSILEEAIGKENKKKPLTDAKLTDLLQEKGYKIARRTVAKYREQLEIPVARLRKEL